MSQSRIRRWVRASALTLLIYLGLGALAAGSVVVTAPRPRAIVSGSMQVSADVTNVADFSYALLSVDKETSSVSNALPVSFAVDTTQYANGTHTLQIDIYNVGGEVATSSKILFVVLNALGGETAYLPPPATNTTVEPLMLSGPDKPQVNVGPVPTTTVVTTPTIQPDSVTGFVRSSKPLTVQLNSMAVSFPQAPYIAGGRIMVMLRPLIEQAGGTVLWQANKSGESHITVSLTNDRIIFTPESSTVLANGLPAQLIRAAHVRMGRTFVPVTMWHTLLGGTIAYDADYHVVHLNGQAELVTPQLQP
jgi:hypothetical protein